jgi:Tfp pilus assembly protein PilP
MMRPLMKLTTALAAFALFAAPGMRAQTAPTGGTSSKPAQAGKPSAPQAAAKPAPAASKPAPAGKPAATGKPAAKSRAKAPAKAPAKSPAPAIKTVADKKPAESEQKVARRDPFESLIGRRQAQDAMAKNLPIGKPGLQINTLRLDGIVKASNGMIAVVANPQQRTYFLREGDQLYDGKVEKISMEGVTFHEEGKDAFGKPVEREVNKRLYPSAGEQQ